MFRISAVIAISLAIFIIQGYGQCPEKNGRFPVSGQCDSYIECIDGVGEEKLCPDGLLFNDKLSPFAYPCQYPIDVDCAQRGKTQPPQATEDCPHQFGYYRLGDASNCGRFMNCAAGKAFVFECPEGLAYDKDSYRCDWPDQVPDCDAEAYLGFKCPDRQSATGLLGPEENRFYKSPHDCQHYFVCVEGRPRLLNCADDQAFNEITNSCDGIENVTGCAGRSTSVTKIEAASQCPEPNGKFPIEEQCDAYIECIDGVAEEKLCPDGLVFNDELSPDGDCAIKPLVKCGNRLRLQPANATENCPRQFGFYRFGNANHCAGYINCAHGVGTLTYCPFGLAFNPDTYQCDWPDEVEECDPEGYLGFKCPEEKIRPVDEEGNETEPEKLKYYRNEKSCKHYFVCVNGKPRLYSCAQFLVFNDAKKGCDFRSKVSECHEKSERVNLKEVTKLKAIEDDLKGFFKTDETKVE